MFGLYGSPYRQLAIDSMHAELVVPDHAITNEFLGTLVNLQVTAPADMVLPADGEVLLLFAPQRTVALPGRVS